MSGERGLEKLNASDVRVLLLWILAGIIGAGVAYKYFYRAFPEASVDFKVPRDEALAEARSFASAQGAQLDGYRTNIVFNVDDAAKTYLERGVGLEQANRLMAGKISVWYWDARFFRPLQKEEFGVSVDPSGRIVGYKHVLEEAAPGARLERAAAQADAAALLSDTLHVDLLRYDFLDAEANSTERPNRRDWSFTWERKNFRAKDAPYRLSVQLAGDRISGYDEFLKVPEAWTRSYARLRSSNDLVEAIALLPYGFLFGACLYVIFGLGRRGMLNWKGALVLGLILTALWFAETMNELPLKWADYDTNSPAATFVLMQIALALLISISEALTVVLAVVPGEPLYRVSQPEKLRLGVAFRLSGIRSKEFFRACVIGLCLAAVHIGYITIFYIVGGKFGVWAPQDINYTDIVATPFPWIYPLTIGVIAATSEEFLFRFFSIPFLHRITKSKFLAIVLPAFAWGFLHANYPVEPAYIRGIEIGLIGIVAGLVMLRWGIVATLVWHYTVDASLVGIALLSTTSLYLRVSGAIVAAAALAPLAISGVSYFARGGFSADQTLLNKAEPLTKPAASTMPTAPEQVAQEDGVAAATEAPAAVVRRYTAISSRTLLTVIIAGLAGIALLIGVKRQAIGDFVRFQLKTSEATARADQVMRGWKVDPASYHRVASLTYTFDPYTNEYLRRKLGIAGANRIYRDEVPSAFWGVRYFRDSQTEEFFVVLRPDGALHSVHHTLEERAPGPNLTQDEALARAEAFLRSEKKLNLSAWKLADTHADKKPARTDYRFTWEQLAALDPEPAGQESAHIRIELQVQGDEVSGYRIYVKIPEAWRDAESRTSVPQLVQTFGFWTFIAAFGIAALVIFFRSLKQPDVQQVPWRRLAKWCLWVLLSTVVLYASRAALLMGSYLTAVSLKTYAALIGISLLLGVAVIFSGIFFLMGLGWLFLERASGRENLPDWLGMPAPYYRDAFCIGAFGSAALMGLARLPVLFDKWPVLHHAVEAVVPQELESLWPAASAIAGAIDHSFLYLGIIALAAGLIARYIRSKGMRAALVVLFALLLASPAATAGGFARSAVFSLLFVAAVWWGVTRVARFNLLGYFLLLMVTALIPQAVELLAQPNAYFHAQGYAVIAIGAALLAWPLVAWQRASKRS